MSIYGLLDFAKKNFLAVVSIIVLAACGGVYFMNMGKKAELSDKYRVLASQNSNILKNIKFEQGLSEDIDKIEAYAKVVDENLFNINELAANYNYFFRAEARTNVSLSELRQSEVSDNEIKALGLTASKSYKEIRYLMSVKGSHQETLNFLRELEGGPSFYRLEKISVTPDNNGDVELKLSALILGRKEEKKS